MIRLLTQILFLLIPATAVFAADQVVTSVNDSGTGSLREAIGAVGAGETITFDPLLGGETIRLASVLQITQNVIIDASALETRITISGDATGDGKSNDDVRVFSLTAAASNITFDSLTISDGFAPTGGGAGIECLATSLTLQNCSFENNSSAGGGGAIYSGGDALAIANCFFSGNHSGLPDASGDTTGTHGGAIYNVLGDTFISNSTFTLNRAADGQSVGEAGNNTGRGGNGGAIHSEDGTVTIDTCTITNNRAGEGNGHGGALNAVAGTVTIRNSTLHGNRAGAGGITGSVSEGGHGGAIYYEGTRLTIINSTLNDNEAGAGGPETTAIGGDGGGIFLGNGAMTLKNSTISGNRGGNGNSPGGNGGGIFAANAVPAITMANSIVAANTSGSQGQSSDIYVMTRGFLLPGINLIGDNESVEAAFPTPATPGAPNANGDLVGTPISPLSPVLSSLGDHGGPTLVLLPLFGSPAFNPLLGDTSSPLLTDQRGTDRIVAGILDLGAVEAPDYNITAAKLLEKRKAALRSKIHKLKRKLRIAKRKKQSDKARRLSRQLRKAKRRLIAL